MISRVPGSRSSHADRSADVYSFVLKQEGTKISGKAHVEIGDQKKESEVTEGKVDGDKISFVELLNYQGNDLRITYSGQLAGNEIKLARAVGDFAKEELTAKRVTARLRAHVFPPVAKAGVAASVDRLS